MKNSILPAALVVAIGACAPTDIEGPVAVTGCLSGRPTSCEGYGDPTCIAGSDLGLCCPTSATREGVRHLDECVLSLGLQNAQIAGETCTVANPGLPGLCETVTNTVVTLCVPTGAGRRCLRASATLEIRSSR